MILANAIFYLLQGGYRVLGIGVLGLGFEFRMSS